MNAAFSKKFNTAVKIINVPIILLLILMHIMSMTSGLINESNRQDAFLDFISGFSFGSFGALFVMVIINGMFFSYLNQLKVLPFTKKDVKDISLLNIFINIIIFTVIQCIITAIMRPAAIPYFICINTVNIAFSIGYLLLLFSDKRRYNAQAATEDPLSRRQNIKLIIVMALGMISIMALTSFIYYFAARGNLAKDLPMLIAITAAAIIISAVEIFVYRKKKIEF
ncbi:MAG: hypothetical protein K2N71_01640 [Oscillospiraceae bacterium]|nr:hypothetical protein [Oscillospiraceae bacterium]